MVTVSRRLIAAVVLLLIAGNLWYLSRTNGPLELGRIYSPYGNATAVKTHGGPAGSASVSATKVAAGAKATSSAKSSHSDASSSVDSDTGHSKGHDASKYKTSPVDAYEAGMQEIKAVLEKMLTIKPDISPLKNYNRVVNDDLHKMNHGELPATSSVLSMYLEISEDDVAGLKLSHEEAVKLLPKRLKSKAFSGRGLVMTGGGKYFPMVLPAIKWAREVNPDIPIEVWMLDSSEYEPKFCEGLFKQLNAECRVVSDVYGNELASKLLSQYALKPISILGSRFDDMYFMDVDSLPLYDFETVFDSKLYEDTGMILNSDYWPRLINPRYYDIAGVKLGDRARGFNRSDALLQADREGAVPGMSTESGQVFISKTRHIRSLLLTTYYNIYGPEAFFSVLMQHGPGEGDKDTYAAAATILGEKYYQTQKGPTTLGSRDTNKEFHGNAMVQPDPLRDFARYEEGSTQEERFLALHANYIKANPKHMLHEDHSETIRGSYPLKRTRYLGPRKMVNKQLNLPAKTDAELHLFSIMRAVTCDWALKDGYVPKDWEDADLDRLCRLMQKHEKWLESHPEAKVIPDEDYVADE